VTWFNRLVERFDRYQQLHGWLGLPLGVVRKYGDDRGGFLAALIAYYGFLSIFPLMLVLVTVLGMVLSGNPSLQKSIENSALQQFPVIGPQLKENVDAISGNTIVLVIGIVGSLWGGLGVMAATQNAFDEAWGVPLPKRSNFFISKLRSIAMLIVLGAFLVASTFLVGWASALNAPGWVTALLGVLAPFVLNLGLYMVAFWVLTALDVGWRDILPGAIVGAVGWTALQIFGGFLVERQVRNATQLYGVFGLVIGTLFWIYLGAQLTTYSAELNVVLKRRQWPRSLTAPR
jgi:inner membrane protein YhjD